MARTTALFALLLLLAGCGDSEEETGRSREDLARLAFEALRTDDGALLVEAYTTASDLDWIARRTQAEGEPEHAAAATALLEKEGAIDALAAQAMARLQGRFRTARDESAKVIDWDAATFDGMVKDQSMEVEAGGLTKADVWFQVRSGERVDLFRLESCAKADEGWITMGGLLYVASPHASAEDALLAGAKKQLQMLWMAVGAWRHDHSALPASLADLQQIRADSGKPYLPGRVTDPWGNDFVLDTPEEGAFRIRSMGPDGERETEDDLLWPPARPAHSEHPAQPETPETPETPDDE